LFDRITRAVAWIVGQPWVFVLSVALILIWLATGPLFGFSDTWQLIANTVTTLITTLMVFLIQADANRGFAATQAKLDELIRASLSRNELIGLEELSSSEIELIRKQILTARQVPPSASSAPHR
jgi:low affinity Fe/Cu permease